MPRAPPPFAHEVAEGQREASLADVGLGVKNENGIRAAMGALLLTVPSSLLSGIVQMPL